MLSLYWATPAAAPAWPTESHSTLYFVTSPPPLSAEAGNVIMSDVAEAAATLTTDGGSAWRLGDSNLSGPMPAVTEYPKLLYAYMRT